MVLWLPIVEGFECIPTRRCQVRRQSRHWGGSLRSAIVLSCHKTIVPTLARRMGASFLHVGVRNDDWCFQYNRFRAILRHMHWSRLRHRILDRFSRQRSTPGILRLADGTLDSIYHSCSRERTHGPLYHANIQSVGSLCILFVSAGG